MDRQCGWNSFNDSSSQIPSDSPRSHLNISFSHPINLPGPILLQSSVGLGLLAEGGCVVWVGWNGMKWNEDALYAPYNTPVIYMSTLLLVLRQAGTPSPLSIQLILEQLC